MLLQGHVMSVGVCVCVRSYFKTHKVFLVFSPLHLPPFYPSFSCHPVFLLFRLPSFLPPMHLSTACISASVDALLHQSSSSLSLFIVCFIFGCLFPARLTYRSVSPTSSHPFPSTAYRPPRFTQMSFCLFLHKHTCICNCYVVEVKSV